MMYKDALELRYESTIRLLKENVNTNQTILDLGTPNELSRKLKDLGYKVYNTEGEDLDLLPETVKKYKVDVVTAFEILEHMVSPFTLLKAIEAPILYATIPLRLWFSSAYHSNTDTWDRHFHEFEDWQFNWLLEKSGWKIEKTEKWISPPNKINGFRPILRYFTPRYYAVIAKRNK